MNRERTVEGQHTRDFSEVHQAELRWIDERRRAAGVGEGDNDTVGLALSGGGLRSATFNLGILQALAQHGLLPRVDYLSSVSGGGYIASCLTWLLQRIAPGPGEDPFNAPVAGGRGTVIDWLRAHGKFLTAGGSYWTLIAAMLTGTLLNLLVLVPVMIALIAGLAADWMGPLDWPSFVTIPGAGMELEDHDGFALLLVVGAGLLVLYAATILLFALGSRPRPTRGFVLRFAMRDFMGMLLAFGLGALAVGLIPVAVSIDEAVIAMMRRDLDRTNPVHMASDYVTYVLPILTGAAALLRARSNRRRGRHSELMASFGLGVLIYGMYLYFYHLAHHQQITDSPVFWSAFLASVAVAFLCNVNLVSMHSYYRNRLAEAFLPDAEWQRQPRAEAVHAHDFRLCDIRPDTGAPYHIINTNLNTSNSRDERLRGRGGDSFTLAPLYCGSSGTGFRRTGQWRNGGMDLATAFTISGAAIDPNTYATSSRAISFVMTLLNFRLGFWTINPRYKPAVSLAPWWYLFMHREMLGQGMDERHRHIHLSDGGHFENLGLYELLRRKCRYIIAGDAGADSQATLSDLRKPIQRARIDFGVEVDINADHLFVEHGYAMGDCPFLVGSIRYADGATGELLYIKPMMRMGLTVDIYSYWRENPEFPNQPTSDQFFDEAQFEAYRELGRQILAGLIGDATSIEDVFERARNWTHDHEIMDRAGIRSPGVPGVPPGGPSSGTPGGTPS